ncbi:MAG: type II secretion system inner membrane protein GspF [Proteobacteria bacterium]|nr:type II secretion system inner membrane protein GspF [Pseudomonadota bacterium]
MAFYRYIGVSIEGKTVNGVMEADSQKGAKIKLKQKGIYATSVVEKGAADTQEKKDTLSITIGKKIKGSDIATMTRQFSTLVNASVPIVDTLEALSEQVENERLKLILKEITQKVNEGVSIANGLAPYSNIFSPLYVNMVRAGEASGKLGLVLERLAEYTEKQSILKNKIMSTMAYPILMVIVSIVIVGILFVVVIPKISIIFEDMGTALPIYTQILIAISTFTKNYILYIIGTVFVSIFLFRRYIKTPVGKQKWDQTQLKIPMLGRIIRLSAIGQFTRTLSTLYGAGVPLLEALEIVSNTVDNVVIKDVIKGAKMAVSEGKGLAVTLAASKQFPPIVTHMISVGEKTGELETMLKHISDSYEIEVETRIQTLTSLLEPAMIIMMGGTVAFIVLSILMPIMQMTSMAS